MPDLARMELVRGFLAVEEDRRHGQRLLAEIKTGDRDWESLTAEERRVISGVAIIELMLEKSFACRFDDPEEMVSLARGACVLANALSPGRYGPKAVADIQARAWAELGNAHRVADDLESAGASLSRARELVEQGTGSPQLLCRILELAASHLTDLRHFKEAVNILRDVELAYLREFEPESVARVLVQQGHILLQSNEPKDAYVAYLRALSFIKPQDSLRLPILQGLLLSMVESGMAEPARVLQQRYARWFRRAGRLHWYRFVWLEGKVAFALEEWGRAEAKLNVARFAYQRVGKAYDAALVSLDLALLYVKRDRRPELSWLVDGILRTFQNLGIAREAIASLVLLRKSCEQQQSLEMVRGQIVALTKLIPELPRGRRRALLQEAL